MKSLLLWFPVRVFGGVLFIFLLWQFWVFLQPRPRALSTLEANAVERAVDLAVARLEPAVPGPARFGVAHILNDPRDQVTTLVRMALLRHEGWTVNEGSVIQRFLSDVTEALSQATSLEEIVRAGQKVDMDVVIAGRVLAVDATNGVGRAVLQLYAYDTRAGAWLLKDDFTADWKPNVAQRTAIGLRGLSGLARLALWLGVVLVFPWVTAFATHWALDRKTNLSSLLVVSGYTLVGLLFALVLVRPALGQGLPGWPLIGAFLFGTIYNYWACERIAERAR